MADADYKRWLCEACGYIYDEAEGDPDSGLAPGTRYDDIPEDWQCPLCGLRKADLVPMPEPVAVAASVNRRAFGGGGKCRGGDDFVVIVGGGIAGWSVAEAIRRRDPERPILLVSACAAAVYPKPALSMAMANGKRADDLIDKDGATRANELGIDLRAETRVIKFDPEKRKLTTARGAIQYGQLVLALGASQRELPLSGDAGGDVLRVNDLISYRTLRARIDAGARHVTLLGAGLIGCEFAEDLSSSGVEVTVVDPATRALSALIPEHISSMLETRLAARGVRWRLGQTLNTLERHGQRLRATPTAGDAFDTDVVLSAAGLVPNITLAAKAGLAVDIGIRVDHEMRTSDERVYALGDCASVDGQVFAYIEPIRRQAEAIAAAVVGEQEPFESLPPLVRVKTPSLPLTICPAPRAANDNAHWAVVEADDEGCRMEYRGEDGARGFALCGKQASFGMDLYKQLAR